MSIESLALRVYARKGFNPADFDAEGLRPGMCIVSPVRPPKSVSGIHTDAVWDNVPASALMIYRVVSVAPSQPSTALAVKPGDVVVLRNAHLDPLQPNGEFAAIFTKHLLQKLKVEEG